jgi:hypothetical protein
MGRLRGWGDVEYARLTPNLSIPLLFVIVKTHVTHQLHCWPINFLCLPIAKVIDARLKPFTKKNA